MTGDPAGGRLLGLDEAGRGSVLGPLVVGGFLCDGPTAAGLRDLGVRDSKLLGPARRRELAGRLAEIGTCLTVAIPPGTIDARVRHHGLNDLEARAFARLVRRSSPDRVFLDACDVNAERFGERVRALSGAAVPHHAQHRADRDLPIVGAASIVAKVARDAAIARLARRLGVEIGSGYPSDPQTREFVEATVRAGGPPPAWLRASWATTRRLMRAARVVPLERFAP